jgi:hypothetical protein
VTKHRGAPLHASCQVQGKAADGHAASVIKPSAAWHAMAARVQADDRSLCKPFRGHGSAEAGVQCSIP